MSVKDGTASIPMEHLELFAWIGEDEYGSGEIGLKQCLVPAGLVPMAAIRQEKMEKYWESAEAQARTYGKRIYLVRFQAVEVLRQTEAGTDTA